MYKGSEKEYELLKNEIEIIKKSILQFIGFIISIAGIAVAIAKIFFNPKEGDDNSVIILGAIVSGLVAITLLFEVIWYKFKSHNRYAGYIQLLTQEVGCVDLNNEIRNIRKGNRNRSQLDDIKITDNQSNSSQNLFTWEFMMARLNNADFENTKLNRILIAIKKIHFKFRIPNHYKYESLDSELRNKIEENYFKDVVKQIYTPQKNYVNKIFDKIHDGFWGFLDLYIPIRHSFFKKRFKRVNRRYLSTGWLFPKKVIQVVFLPIILLLIFFFSVIYSNYELTTNFLIEANISYPVTFMSFLAIVIAIIWIFRYVGGLKSVIFGEYSAQYFCWSFFIIRVQLLNSYNIFPIYFSRNFVLYFKHIKMLDNFNQLYIQSQFNETKKCLVCENKKNKWFELNKTITKKENTLNRFERICSNCNERYKKTLNSGAKIPNQFNQFHSSLIDFTDISLNQSQN